MVRFARRMRSQTFLLCALIPPGSVEASVGRVQEALFSEHGLASAQAVPPLIPIAFLDPDRLPGQFLRQLDHSAPFGWRARLQRAEWVEGHLYARVDSDGAWSALRKAVLAKCGMQTGGLFPVAEGFYLGCGDAPEAMRPGINPSIPPTSFSSATVALIGLHPALGGPAWWSELHWEIMEDRHLRGRKER
jgi:hypothetical protein